MAFKLTNVAVVVGSLVCGAAVALLVSGRGNVNDEGTTPGVVACSLSEAYDSTLDKCVALNAPGELGELSAAVANPKSVEVEISHAVNSMIPNLDFEPQDVSYIERADLYAFTLEGKVFYTTEKVKAFISGDVLDLALLKAKPERSNITVEISRSYNGGAPRYTPASSGENDSTPSSSSNIRSDELYRSEMASVEQRISSAVNKLIPNLNLQPRDVSYIDSVDLFAFMLAGKVFFTTDDVKSLISGDVIDLELLRSNPERSNVTAEFLRIFSGGVSEDTAANTEYNISKLDTKRTINIGSDTATRKFAVMFDISCPKSRDLYPKLVEIVQTDKNVQFNLMLISRMDSQSVKKQSKEIFCATDNKRALDFFMKTSILDQSLTQVEGCAYNPDYPSLLMGGNFSGTTPVFYSDKNSVLVGNKDIAKIRDYVSK